MAEKDSRLIVDKLKSETECCICTETYTDPRVLPCNHTFCLKCLTFNVAMQEEGSGDKMSCPVCRKEVTIPVQGLTGLQKNFFMERVIDITKISKPAKAEGVEVLCDLCAEATNPDCASMVPPAEMYCVNCRQRLCEECSIHHKKNKVTKTHKIVPNGSQNSDEALDEVVLRLCEEHGKEHLIYCENCREVVCPLCFIEKHGLHKGLDANKFISDFRNQVDGQSCDFSEFILQSQEKQQMLEDACKKFALKMKFAKEAISKVGEGIKNKIDRHVNSLKLKLDSLTRDQLKEITAHSAELEDHIDSLESYQAYCNSVVSFIDTRDIFQTMSNISDTAHHMKQQHQLWMDREVPKLEVPEYESWLNIQVDFGHTEGNLDGYKENPVLLHTFLTKTAGRGDVIRGMTLLGEELSVVHGESAWVVVYNATTLCFHREYIVEGLINPRDLTSCQLNKCMYILDDKTWEDKPCRILKVSQHGYVLHKWFIGKSSGALSVTCCGNIILAYEKLGFLKEYTSDGRLLRSIMMDNGSIPVTGVRHAVQQSEDHLLVCYSNEKDEHGLFLLNSKTSYAVKKFSDCGRSVLKLKVPVFMALDGDQNVFLVDQENRRVVMLDSSSLEFKRELLAVQHGLHHPERILLDEFGGRLFVVDLVCRPGECEESQILVFDIKSGCHG